jgi:uncharacterized protein
MDRDYGSFAWDAGKEAINLAKHGVDFVTASRVFLDPKRKIFVNERHSGTEERFYCIGNVDGRILTVRLVYRGKKIRIFGAGYWRGGRKYYESEK